jgi:ABC-type multidrug transport system fused ATPase/permease subunit
VVLYLWSSVTYGSAQTELLDEFANEVLKDTSATRGTSSTVITISETVSGAREIGFNQAVFSWSADESSERVFKLQIERTLFKKGKMNLIVGPTGCGKTSMLLALLGMLLFLSVYEADGGL